jgi:hypothetical protein
MRKNDAWKIKYNELTELRKRGISAVQDGQPIKIVSQALGVQRSTWFDWLAHGIAGDDGTHWMRLNVVVDSQN